MAESGPATGRIFISYRREETAYPAGWLFDRLSDHFGSGQVFKDVDSIELGDDFVEVISAAVGSCDVLLALIGDRWLTITDENGRRRLEDPSDFVRIEIEAALSRDVRVIPILVEGARVPRADEVPPSLAKLVRRQALELSPSRFDFDTGRLLKVLDKTLADVRTAVEDAPRQPADDETPDPTIAQPGERAEHARRTPAGIAPETVVAPDAPSHERKPSDRRVSTRALILAGIGVGVAIITLLIVVKVNPDTPANPQDDSSDRASSIIFQDNFSERSSGWDLAGNPVGGHYRRDAYHILVEEDASGEFAWGTPPRGSEELFPEAPPNLRIEVDAEKLAGGADPEDGYGIFCRGAENGETDYSFILGNDQVTVGKSAPDGAFRVLDTGPSPAVDLNSTTQLRAECTSVDGEQAVRLKFWVNDEVVAEATDREDPFLTGSVGLFAYTVKAMEVEFDNFIVTEI